MVVGDVVVGGGGGSGAPCSAFAGEQPISCAPRA